MIAMMRDEQHWMLNDADAKVYATAMQNALRHIPIKSAQKSVDFAAFAICVMQMETPRLYRSTQLAKLKRHPPQQFQPPRYPMPDTGDMMPGNLPS